MNRLWLVFVLVLAVVLAGCVYDDAPAVTTAQVAAPSPSAKFKATTRKTTRKAALKSAALPPMAETPKPLTVMTDRQKAFFNNRRIARTRDVTTIPGSVIVYYERNGKPDGVTTNVLHSVTGAAQSNPIKVELERVRQLMQTYQARVSELEGSFADAAEIRRRLEAYRDNARLATTKTLINQVIEEIFGAN